MYIKEDINISGRVDVWNHDEPQKGAGISGLCAAALGIGLLSWLFKKEEPKQIMVVPPTSPAPIVVEDKPSDAFAFVFCFFDCAKKILREKNSEQAKECVKDFTRSFIDVIEAHVDAFTDMEFKMIKSMLDDVIFIMGPDASKA